MKTQTLLVGPGIRVAPAALEDAEALAGLVQRNRAWLGAWLPPVVALGDVVAARTHLAYAASAAQAGELYEWHIFHNDVLCGSVRVNHIDAVTRKASIGYYLDAQQQGQGLASRAARAVLGWCFGQMDFNRIVLKCATGNAASRRVAERLGFSHEGILRHDEVLNGAFIDNHVYGLLKAEYLAREAPPASLPKDN